MILLFLKGLVAGAAISTPIGPIGILCLRRILLQGPFIGIFSGLGSACADVLYASAALAGLSIISNFLVDNYLLFQAIASIILSLIGLHIFFNKSELPKKPRISHGILEAFFSTLILTLANPALIVSFILSFALLGIEKESIESIIPVVTGVFCGSMAWWISLATLAHVIKPTFNQESLMRINKISGTAMGLLGLFFFVGSLIKFFMHS